MLLTSPSHNLLISKMGMIIIYQVRLISALGLPQSCCQDKMQLKYVKATCEPGRRSYTEGTPRMPWEIRFWENRLLIHLFKHLFNKYALKAYCVPGLR